MSNSIWHKYDIKDTPNPHHEILAWTGTKHAVVIIKRPEWRSGDCDWIESWAYIRDILAQADKAERLQKAVDDSREKLAAFMHDVWGNWFAYQLNNSTIENLQRWGIQSNTPYSSLTETEKDKDRKFADKIIEIIKNEIKQLIKENNDNN